MKDPYIILSVARDSELKDIRQAYHKLAREHHPDHGGVDEARFQDITWAWNLLRNPTKRQEWDDKHKPAVVEETQESVVSHLPQRGEDIVYTERISFAEAYRGTMRQVPVNRQRLCEICGGSGAKPGSIPHPCLACGGRGFHRAGRLEQACSNCHGKGVLIHDPCTQCDEGLISENVLMPTTIPSRTKNGDRIVIVGGGHPGWAEAGDLIFEIATAPSQVYQEGADGDLIVDVPVTWSEAVLGGSITVPTPEGPQRINLPSSTTSGTRFRLASLGLRREDGTVADLWAKIKITVPKDPTPELRRIIVSLRAHEDSSAREELLRKAHQEFE